MMFRYSADAPDCTTATTRGLGAEQFRENALQHFYRLEREAGVPAEVALRNMDEFAQRLREWEARR